MESHRLATFWLMLGSAFITLGTVGCGGADDLGSYTIADSAGVEIVMNRGPAWSEGEGWRVESEFALSIGTVEGDPAYELHRVVGAVRLPHGDIVVLNSGSNELRFYDATGQHLRSVGGKGDGPGEFQSPFLIFALAGDTVVVWDARQRRVSFFDRTGVLARSFTFPPSTNLYRAAQLFQDRALLAMARVRSVAPQESGPIRGKNLYVVFNLEGDSVAAVGSFPDREMYNRTSADRTVGAALLLGRTTLMATYGKTLYVGTNDAYTIDQYDRDGRLVRSIRRDVAVPVTPEMFATEISVLSERMSEGARAMLLPVFEEMPRPETLPHYSAIETDPGGNIWVRHYASVSMPTFEWTVFDSAGRMLGDVLLPDKLVVYEIGRDYVLGRWRDDADVEYVRLHRLTR